jgi:hypothetical protein
MASGRSNFFSYLFFLIVAAIVFVGCAPTQPLVHEKGNLTAGVVKQSITKGQTTQAEILTKFGAPNMTTRNSAGHEVWNYSRMSYEQRNGEQGGSVILFGGSNAFSSGSTSSFDLIVEFDDKDTVSDYKVIQTQY